MEYIAHVRGNENGGWVDIPEYCRYADNRVYFDRRSLGRGLKHIFRRMESVLTNSGQNFFIILS
jgi:hypothetical protein